MNELTRLNIEHKRTYSWRAPLIVAGLLTLPMATEQLHAQGCVAARGAGVSTAQMGGDKERPVFFRTRGASFWVTDVFLARVLAPDHDARHGKEKPASLEAGFA
jgi:hypothetical protein